ncbi:MAG: hypothetical protein K8R58_01630 [Bacteroidales bacterium]|nr:hypothetical protein [Bacteroidales bacterium]
MDNLLLKIFKIISLIFIILAVVLQLTILIQGDDLSDQVLNNYALLSYLALGLTTFLALLFPIIFMILDPKKAIKVFLAFAGLVIIGVISYSFASNSFNIEELQRLDTTVETSKIVGASLYFTYIIGGLTVLSVIYSGISSFFK